MWVMDSRKRRGGLVFRNVIALLNASHIRAHPRPSASPSWSNGYFGNAGATCQSPLQFWHQRREKKHIPSASSIRENPRFSTPQTSA
jgi:hypothetical protein